MQSRATQTLDWLLWAFKPHMQVSSPAEALALAEACCCRRRAAAASAGAATRRRARSTQAAGLAVAERRE